MTEHERPTSIVTIRAMVRVGPWTVEEVRKELESTHCERCDAEIKEVWVCRVDEGSPRLEELDGKAVWRIGSTCGPTLIAVSDEMWHEHEKPLKSRLRLALRATAVLNTARERSYKLPAFIEERTQELLDGTLADRLRRHLGLVVTTQGRMLKLWK